MGAKPKLTDGQTSQLRSWLVGREPRQFQFDFTLRTPVIVGELIRAKFGVEMTPRVLHAGTFTGPTGMFRQRTDLSKPQRDLLAKLGIPAPKKMIALAPASP